MFLVFSNFMISNVIKNMSAMHQDPVLDDEKKNFFFQTFCWKNCELKSKNRINLKT